MAKTDPGWPGRESEPEPSGGSIPRSGLRLPMPRGPGKHRSITIGGNVNGASMITGDHNTSTVIHTAPPPTRPGNVDPAAELAALRKLLAQLHAVDAGKLGRALADADEEATKAEPDRAEVGDALARVGKYARAATNFADLAEQVAPHVAAFSSWIGAGGEDLLSAFGYRV